MGVIRFLFRRIVIVLVAVLVVVALPSAGINNASASRALQQSHARQGLDKLKVLFPMGALAGDMPHSRLREHQRTIGRPTMMIQTGR